MSQYFENDIKVKNRNLMINFLINNINFSLKSNDGVFSKNRLDKGSEIFIKYLLKLPLKGMIFDYGCGNGVIGIVLNESFKELCVTYCDINVRCLELVKENLESLSLRGNIINAINLEQFDEKFDYIFLNSPIRSGKDNIFKMYLEANRLLKENGEFYVIIRKDKGMESHKAKLKTIFKNADIVYKEKGYYILKMEK